MHCLRWGVPLSAAVLVVAGCGGSKGSSSNPTVVVSPRVTIAWPTRTRDFAAPASALGAWIVLERGMSDGNDYTFYVNRPTDPAASTQTYIGPSTARSGTYVLRIYFQALADTISEPVAVSSATVRVDNDGSIRNADGSALGNVGFTSNIRSAFVIPDQIIDSGDTKSLAVNVISTSGGLLAVSPDSIQLNVTEGQGNLRARERLWSRRPSTARRATQVLSRFGRRR